MKNITILQELENYLRTKVNPKALAIDHDPQALKLALQGLIDRKLLAVNIPQAYGGPGFTTQEYHLFKKMLGRYSGALLFLQTQHQTAAELILKGTNENLKSAYLPRMYDGQLIMGVGFSHLRQWQQPAVLATQQANGYLIENAIIRFITGFDFFYELLIGFVAEVNGQPQEFFAIISGKNNEKDTDSFLCFSSPIELKAAYSTNTVSLQLKNWFIPEHQIVSQGKLGSFYQRGLTATNIDSFITGTTAAVLDLVATTLPSPLPAIADGHTLFTQRLIQHEVQILARTPETLVAPIRVAGLQLCDQTLAFARQAFRGRIMLQTDPIAQHLQRLSHERDLFSIAMAGDDLLQATIASSS